MGSQDGSRWHRDGPRWRVLAPDWRILAPDWCVLAPDLPILAPNCLILGLHWRILAPHWRILAPGWGILAPDWRMLAPDWRMLAPYWSKDGPRRSQDGLNMVQHGAKMEPRWRCRASQAFWPHPPQLLLRHLQLVCSPDGHSLHAIRRQTDTVPLHLGGFVWAVECVVVLWKRYFELWQTPHTHALLVCGAPHESPSNTKEATREKEETTRKKQEERRKNQHETRKTKGSIYTNSRSTASGGPILLILHIVYM